MDVHQGVCFYVSLHILAHYSTSLGVRLYCTLCVPLISITSSAEDNNQQKCNKTLLLNMIELPEIYLSVMSIRS